VADKPSEQAAGVGLLTAQRQKKHPWNRVQSPSVHGIAGSIMRIVPISKPDKMILAGGVNSERTPMCTLEWAIFEFPVVESRNLNQKLLYTRY
jgi:hypothetical protein